MEGGCGGGHRDEGDTHEDTADGEGRPHCTGQAQTRQLSHALVACSLTHSEYFKILTLLYVF